jgi:hypothetical protein
MSGSSNSKSSNKSQSCDEEWIGDLIWSLVKAAGQLLWWAMLFPAISVPILISVFVVIRFDLRAGMVTTFVVTLAYGLWAWFDQKSFESWAVQPVRRRWLMWWRYSRCWEPVCTLHGLTAKLGERTLVPVLRDLYARDTWQLVHAGCQGGHHNIPTAIARHPQVFATLTAPSYGPVHGSAGRMCHDHKHSGGYRRCEHEKPLWCSRTHDDGDNAVGQPLCGDCYDYTGHVLFIWHLPELWRRFTIALRRRLAATLRAAGADPATVRVSFVKVVEMQARAIPHIHALIRLDPTTSDSDTSDWGSPVNPTELAALIQQAARSVTLTVDDDMTGTMHELRFGTQIDTQPIVSQSVSADCRPAQSDSPTSGVPGRRVAGYLAKYVTKSLADFGISVRRITTAAIGELDVSDHVRAILGTIAQLAQTGATGIGKWLHTLGYRGHITTKSHCYSTTMGALRMQRAHWNSNQTSKDPANQHDSADTVNSQTPWCFDRAGHASQVTACSSSVPPCARSLPAAPG